MNGSHLSKGREIYRRRLGAGGWRQKNEPTDIVTFQLNLELSSLPPSRAA
jgi:hypothetical protein